jgi:hypothetical protein
VSSFLRSKKIYFYKFMGFKGFFCAETRSQIDIYKKKDKKGRSERKI